MAYDPATGKFTDETESVQDRLTGLLSRDSDYMKQAETVGARAVKRRGLLNSTMAVTAVEDSRIRAALPIASQDASEANQRYLQGRQLQSSDIQQGKQIESTEGMQQRGLLSSEGIEERRITSVEGMQGRQISSVEGMQGRDIQSREGMQLTEIAARYGLLAQQLAQLDEAQLRDIASREGMLDTELQNLIDRQQTQIESDQFMQGLDLETRERMLGLDIESRERIASMNIEASDRNAAANMAVGFEIAYANTVAGIMNNSDIPAAERQRYLDHAANIRNNNYALIEQMFGIELEWAVTAPPVPDAPPGWLPEWNF